METEEAYKIYERERKKEYRAKRKLEGNPVKSGSNRKPSDHLEKFACLKFVGYDSEGINHKIGDKIEHRTSFIANSEGDEIVYPHGIPASEGYKIWIPYLYNTGVKYKSAIKIWYYASYDWTMMLKGLEEYKLQEIYDRGCRKYTYIRIGEDEYKIKILPRTSLTIAKCKYTFEEYQVVRGIYEDAGMKPPSNTEHVITFYDIAKFYQQSFVQTIVKILGKDYPILKQIQAGKNKRGSETHHTKETAEYCRAELKALVLIAEDLKRDLIEIDLPIRHWNGPGSIASAIMKKHDMLQYKNDPMLFYQQDKDNPQVLGDPTPLGEAVLSAFYGARIEMIQYGTCKDTHDYDLNSCYPEFLSQAPSFHPDHGEWMHIQPYGGIQLKDIDRLSPYSLLLIRYNGDKKQPFHPFSHRAAHGSIWFPPKTEGWHHYCEVKALLDSNYKNYELQILDCWSWEPTPTAPKPWKQLVNTLYLERKQFQKQGKGAEKVIKLGLNSLYGKIAQRIGANRDYVINEIGLPATQDLYIAGFITANARSALYGAAMKKPDAIISFATDGLTCTEKLPGMNLGANLGQWEYKHWNALSQFMMAGCYHLRDSEGNYKLGSRGYRPKMEAEGWFKFIEASWKAGKTNIVINQTVFYALGLALTRKDPLTKLGEWEEVSRSIEINNLSKKRRPLGRQTNPHKGLRLSRPTECPDSLQDFIDGNYYPKSHISKMVWEESEEGKIENLQLQAVNEIASMQGEIIDITI